MDKLQEFLLDKLVWAAPHKDCNAGAHGNILYDRNNRTYYLDCPTKVMFKTWYLVLIESGVMNQIEIEKYLESKK